MRKRIDRWVLNWLDRRISHAVRYYARARRYEKRKSTWICDQPSIGGSFRDHISLIHAYHSAYPSTDWWTASGPPPFDAAVQLG